MILEAAIINLTRNLDILNQKDEKSISSHSDQKREALTCLINLIQSAPISEFQDLFKTDSFEILFGYLLNVLCYIFKNDKDRLIRIRSIELTLLIIKQFEQLHDLSDLNQKCTVDVVVTSLPGVSSSLFRLILSDTKLPKDLLVLAVKTLSRMIACVYLPCISKDIYKLDGQKLETTSENLSVRIKLLIDYVMSNTSLLPEELQIETLGLCETIVRKTRHELLTLVLKSIVKYCAFISSARFKSKLIRNEIQLRVLLIIDSLHEKISCCDSTSDNLNSVVMSSLFEILDALENDYLSALVDERCSALSTFHGFLKLLPPDSLITLLEINERRTQLFGIFIQLSKFSTDQAFLFLTNYEIPNNALEICDEKIYTIEKRFANISNQECRILVDCMKVIGKNLSFNLVQDLLRTELGQFSSAEELFVTNSILEGCLERSSVDTRALMWTTLTIEYFVEKTHEEYISLLENTNRSEKLSSQLILKTVIAIETILSLMKIFLKFSTSQDNNTMILRSTLCPILNWASSSSRAISEAALACLSHLSYLYKLGSTKALIEINIDYIVDGVSKMLDDFAHNSQITSVLAITFKLSSIETFYYFKDVYERIFTILASYHQTHRSKIIALLFYRTLSILGEWKDVQNSLENPDIEFDLLDDATVVKKIRHDLDIERRLKSLDEIMRSSNERQENIDEMMKITVKDESRIIQDIETAKSGSFLEQEQTPVIGKEEDSKETVDGAKSKKRPVEIILTEKILHHCINLASSNFPETRTLAVKSIACGIKVLGEDEDTLLPLVHKLWTPLFRRLTENHDRVDLELKLCSFECLMSMAYYAKDFLKRRTLDQIIPRLCLFLETQAKHSLGQKLFGPYCMTESYKCQLKVLGDLGALAYHIQLAYSSLWRIIKAVLLYLDTNQISSLQEAAKRSLHFLIGLDADCVWYFAHKAEKIDDLPFKLIYDIN